MPTTQTHSHVTFQIAEEGEAIGTVQQFADRTNLPRPRVLSCLEQSDTATVALPIHGGEADWLLITDADGLAALFCCAADEALP